MGYDRKSKEAAFIEAVGKVILEDGPQKLGINAIARAAGANKSLIYRYFDGLEGLFKAFAASNSIWPSNQEIIGDALDNYHPQQWRRAAATILKNHAEALRKRPLALEILAWECVERNALTIALEEVREQRSLGLFAAFQERGLLPAENIMTPIALISSSINYLAVRTRKIQVFGGAQVGSEEFWEQELPETIEKMLQGYN